MALFKASYDKATDELVLVVPVTHYRTSHTYELLWGFLTQSTKQRAIGRDRHWFVRLTREEAAVLLDDLRARFEGRRSGGGVDGETQAAQQLLKKLKAYLDGKMQGQKPTSWFNTSGLGIVPDEYRLDITVDVTTLPQLLSLVWSYSQRYTRILLSVDAALLRVLSSIAAGKPHDHAANTLREVFLRPEHQAYDTMPQHHSDWWQWRFEPDGSVQVGRLRGRGNNMDRDVHWWIEPSVVDALRELGNAMPGLLPQIVVVVGEYTYLSREPRLREEIEVFHGFYRWLQANGYPGAD